MNDDSGTNALIEAALARDAAAVRAVLAAGQCDLEARDKRDRDGRTAFLTACQAGSVECMELLVDAGCDTGAKCMYEGANALHHAARSGNPAAVRTALAAPGWCDIEAGDRLGQTAFMFACRSGSVECMELLVDAGCDTSATTKWGSTAMHFAHGPAIEWLSERETQHKLTVLERLTQELVASSRLSEAKAVAERAAPLLPAKEALAHLRDKGYPALAGQFEEMENRARKAEAELMAMLDGETPSNEPSLGQADKARRKKEKLQRQQQAKKEAVRRAQEPEPEPEPEPELDPEAGPAVEAKSELKADAAPDPAPKSKPVSNLGHQPSSCSLAGQEPTRVHANSEPDGLLKAVRTPPDELCCPITSECMRDPVIVAATGMTYEREAIVEWLSKHDIDPSTGVELGKNHQLVPNVLLRKMIEVWSRSCMSISSESSEILDHVLERQRQRQVSIAMQGLAGAPVGDAGATGAGAASSAAASTAIAASEAFEWVNQSQDTSGLAFQTLLNELRLCATAQQQLLDESINREEDLKLVTEEQLRSIGFKYGEVNRVLAWQRALPQPTVPQLSPTTRPRDPSS